MRKRRNVGGAKCPKCRRVQYYTCGNPKCQCANIPPGKQAQKHLGYDIIACPYCGHSAHIDFWADRDMRLAQNEDSHSEPEWISNASQSAMAKPEGK